MNAVLKISYQVIIRNTKPLDFETKRIYEFTLHATSKANIRNAENLVSKKKIRIKVKKLK